MTIPTSLHWNRSRPATCLIVLTVAMADDARAQRSITYGAETFPHPGVRLQLGRYNQSASVGSEFYAAFVDLCADDIAIASTAPRTSLQTTSGWADPGGIFLAVNGDFYEDIGGSWYLYGDAVGNALQWPAANSGLGIGSWHWAQGNYGWIAVGPGWVDYTHTEQVKLNRVAYEAAGWGAGGGWMPDTVAPPLRPDTYNLISGFPELVTEGRVYTCPDPTGGCFPDRGDMADRHPRTAIGLSEDRRVMLMVVVDGRSMRASAGVTGEELAWLMGQLGAWQALNLDGGGSSTMWLRGVGVVNAPSGGSERSVFNHLGVFAGSGGLPGTNCCPQEVCDGIDNDCDQEIDEGCPPPVDASVPDNAVPDALRPDAAVPDARSPDIMIVDSAVADSALVSTDVLSPHDAARADRFSTADGRAVEEAGRSDDSAARVSDPDQGGDDARLRTGCACRAARSSSPARGALLVLLLGWRRRSAAPRSSR